MKRVNPVAEIKFSILIYLGISISVLTITPLIQAVEINPIQVPYAFSEKSEQWEYILDNGQGSGNLTLYETQAGDILADGNWEYTYQGMKAIGPFTEATVSISGKTINISATGIATSPSAPPGYNTSSYTLNISGMAYNGLGSGTFVITYQTYGWPNRISGIWEGTRTSGNGITAEDTPQIRYMPWIYLLLKN